MDCGKYFEAELLACKIICINSYLYYLYYFNYIYIIYYNLTHGLLNTRPYMSYLRDQN